MTKKALQAALRRMTERQAKDLLLKVTYDAIAGGRRLQMTSSEILGTVCDVLREGGLDDPHPP